MLSRFWLGLQHNSGRYMYLSINYRPAALLPELITIPSTVQKLHANFDLNNLFKLDTATRLANKGYAVYGIDYEGHGESSGQQGYIPSFDDLVKDCSDYFISVCERQENKEKSRFLLGVSMGGAVVILLHRREPNYWSGAILLAPLCKIDDKMKPPAFLISILKKLSKIIPTWKVIPAKDMIDVAIKSPEKRQEVRSNPYCYKGNLPLRTGHELLMVSLDIEKNLHQVSLPFLVMHGGDDKIIDPSGSQLLYNSASSSDKTLKLYPGMWHGLTFGEPPEIVERFFSDMVAWLDQRTCMKDQDIISS
ncbi:caffeoylshikimate esterase-like isoform X3 [Canna indica]|uniref:Caffeoylshikimate esterase-like isoform X3 n=1 Tax=Canna indica TaxID=4628 RepID=A0AAQ3QMV3_9LILI|nr:caffeoylshikimate esterase-like isoform X3 [Canna indica]